MNETGTAARAWMNPTEAEQWAETQIRRPSFRLISGLEKTVREVTLIREASDEPRSRIAMRCKM